MIVKYTGALQNTAKPVKTTRIQKRNQRRILDAAQDIFAAYGFHGATIEKIAEKAQMSKPNLHYYFKRKADLYIAVLERTLETWLAPLSDLDPNGDPAQELGRYIREKLELSRRSPISSRVFANEILQGAPFIKGYLENDLRAMVNCRANVIRGWIAKGRLKDVDAVHLLFLIWSATQHYADFQPQVMAVMNVPRLTKDHYADIGDSLCRIILDGILPSAP